MRKDYYPTHDIECDKHYAPPKRERETIIECGSGSSPGPLCGPAVWQVSSANSIPNGGIEHPVLATVVLDTSDLKDPKTIINFSSLISFRTFAQVAGFYLSLTFQLSKICHGSSIILGTWTFEQAENQYDDLNGFAPAQANGIYNREETDPFGFTWCECGGCPGCCTYQVKLVGQECGNIELATISNIFITGTASGFKKY